MSDDQHRLPYEVSSPRGPAPATPWNPYGSQWAEDAEPEIDVMEYVRLIWSKKWLVLAVLVATVVFSTAWSLTRPKMYRASTKITIQPPPQLSNNQFDLAMSWWQMDRIIADQVEIIKTRAVAERVVEKLGLESHPAFAGGDAVGSLLGGIRAKPIQETFVVEVSLIGRQQHAIAEWLNVYIEQYKAANIEDGINRTKEVYKVIQERLDPLRAKVENSETMLLQFREREDAVLLADQDKNVISEQVSTLTTAYADAKNERIRLETKLNALRSLRATNVSEVSFPEVLKDSTIQSLVGQRNDLQLQLAEKLGSLREGHPEIKDLRARIRGLNQSISDQVDTITLSLQTDFDIASRRERSLFENIQQLREQTIDLSKQTLELDRLQREYDQNKRFLEEMLARSNEADIAQTSSMNNVRVIEPAREPGGPYSPNPKRTAMMATVLGLFLGIGLVLGLDFLDHTLRSPDQVERYLGLETLTALPKLKGDDTRAMRESFQSLRTAVMLAARGEESHVLMITSAVPSEGKTTVAFNLAKVLATGGAKVLLIDADLRKPRLHRMIKAKNVRGLTSVVLGERSASEVIHSFPDIANLDLITSGKQSYRQLLDEAKNNYDWILIDTPPVASVTDPVICARLSELVVLVVQYGSTRRQIVREAIRLLGRTGVHIAGALLNQVDIERDHYYYAGYYSYTRYGYYGDQVPPKTTSSSAAKPTGKAG
jgi:capsular exopolysaccharide synthesis family protein